MVAPSVCTEHNLAFLELDSARQGEECERKTLHPSHLGPVLNSWFHLAPEGGGCGIAAVLVPSGSLAVRELFKFVVVQSTFLPPPR